MKSYTTAEAAVLLGLKPVTVRAHIASGIIVAEKRGRDYLIADEALQRFQARRRGKGRPREQR